MKQNALQKQLVRYSLLVALIVTAAVLIFQDALQIRGNPVLFSLLIGVRFLLLSLLNIALLATKQKRIIRYTGGYMLSFLLFLGTDPIEKFVEMNRIPWSMATRWSNITFECIIGNTLILIIQNFIILQFAKAKTDSENAALKAANLESTNLLLKQQIQPHFLFNALSMMKSLYKTDVHAGEAYLSHLVGFLRASLASPSSGISGLSDELRLCKDYLEMQNTRFESAIRCSIDIPEGVLAQGAVPSFSLQALIENAIKHNEVTELSPLVIRVYYRDGRIVVENNLQRRAFLDAPSGKGLINLIERYKILSGDEVIIREDKSVFFVSIKVLGNENRNHRG